MRPSPVTSPRSSEPGRSGYVPAVEYRTGAPRVPPGSCGSTASLKSTDASRLYPVVATTSARPSPVTSPIATASGSDGIATVAYGANWAAGGRVAGTSGQGDERARVASVASAGGAAVRRATGLPQCSDACARSNARDDTTPPASRDYAESHIAAFVVPGAPVQAVACSCEPGFARKQAPIRSGPRCGPVDAPSRLTVIADVGAPAARRRARRGTPGPPRRSRWACGRSRAAPPGARR